MFKQILNRGSRWILTIFSLIKFKHQFSHKLPSSLFFCISSYFFNLNLRKSHKFSYLGNLNNSLLNFSLDKDKKKTSSVPMNSMSAPRPTIPQTQVHPTFKWECSRISIRDLNQCVNPLIPSFL